jgi:ABC-type branched-subunit amino acid transport system ATPase component
MSEPILSITDLQKRYGSTVALDRVSFQVATGEMFGLSRFQQGTHDGLPRRRS